MPIVRIFPDNKTVEVKPGRTVLDACRHADVKIQSSCGGSGTCNKCMVRVREGHAPPSPQDLRQIQRWELEQGYRLSCQLRVQGDLSIEVPESAREYGEQILSTGAAARSGGKSEPNVSQFYVELPAPTLQDSVSDLDRLGRGLGWESGILEADFEPLRELRVVLREAGFKVTATLCGRRLLRTEAEDTGGRACGLAFDIGTTTVVGYLMDLGTGDDLAVASRPNPQAKTGSDVISRAEYAHQGPEQLKELQRLIVGCLQEIAEECARGAGVALDRCYEVVLGGNTIMTHLAFAVDPRYVTMTPFTPVWSKALTTTAREIGLRLHPQTRIYALPCVAGYVGGDITAGLLATDLPSRDALTLFIDIGTNGEIVLGDRSGWVACASPAGPAFEGARISCGMSAMSGAIDRVGFDPDTGDLQVQTIGDRPPRGICGTGLIDAVAAFLQSGMVEPTGRVVAEDGARRRLPAALAARIKGSGPRAEILLVPKKKTQEKRRDLTLTQRDIRELQLAKGAIRAGVDMALKVRGVAAERVAKVLLAGGFGNYIRPVSAKAIGLLPAELGVEKVEAVGNSAGVGAKMCLTNVKLRERIEALARATEYVELSGRPDFSEVYADAMIFPGEEPD